MDNLLLSFLLMAESDIPDLTPVMTRAFDDDSQKHLGKEKGGPPSWATKNHNFYEKCGFKRVDEDPLIPAEEDSVIYRKEIG